MIANLNTLCKVQLNDFGKMLWLSQVDTLPEDTTAEKRAEISSNLQQKIDEDGCVELELWAIMNIFGPYVSPVNSPFASFAIELSKNPNFKSTH